MYLEKGIIQVDCIKGKKKAETEKLHNIAARDTEQYW